MPPNFQHNSLIAPPQNLWLPLVTCLHRMRFSVINCRPCDASSRARARAHFRNIKVRRRHWSETPVSVRTSHACISGGTHQHKALAVRSHKHGILSASRQADARECALVRALAQTRHTLATHDRKPA